MLVIVLAAGGVFAQTGTAVSGTVTEQSGDPVEGASVSLVDKRVGTERVAVTGADGSFSFQEVRPGAYSLAAKYGDSAARREVTLTNGGSDIADLKLVRKGISELVDVNISAGTSQPIAEVAKTVDLIEKEEVEARGDLSLADTLRTIPGFRVQQLGGFGRTASIKTRGLRNQDTALLIDGMRFRDPSSITGDASAFLSDLAVTGAERIEVLRGSGSSIYGTNAIGGVIDLRTREPERGFHGDASGGFGSLGLWNGRGRVAGGSEKLLGTASFTRTEFTEGIDGDDNARNTGFQGRLDYRPFSDTYLSGRILVSRAFVMLNASPDTLGDVGSGVIDAVPGVNFLPDGNDPDNAQKSDFFLGRLSVAHIFSPKLFLKASYQGLSTKRLNENGVLGPGFQPFGGTESSTFEGRIDTFEARLNWTPAEAKLFTFGFEFESEDYRNKGLGPSQTDEFFADSGQKSSTFYGQVLAGFLDGRLQLAGGARFQGFSIGSTSFSVTNAPYENLTIGDPPNAVTVDGAASYFFRSMGTKIRAHVGNGYRVPSLYERLGTFYSSYSQEFTALGDPELKPERSVAFDAGIDQEFAAGKMRFSATYFYTRLTDTIGFGYPVPDIGTTARPFGGYLNEKGGLARGAEFSATVLPTDSTYVFGSYTYTNSDQRSPQVAGSGVIETLGIPENRFTLLVTQRVAKRLNLSFDLLVAGDYIAPIFSNQTFSTVLYRFKGNRRGDLTATYELPWTGERIRLALHGTVQNLFGDEYYENGFRTEGRTGRIGIGLRF
jgi:iron complex outermembrane receptor protein